MRPLAVKVGMVCLLAASLPAVESAATQSDAASKPISNIVLVHGADIDGSTWRGVYDILAKHHFHVTIVQEPLTGFTEDVAAVKRVIERQEGPVVLVGNSYGGTLITQAGVDSKVKALVYVAALQPDVGESTNQLASSIPGDIPRSDLQMTTDGFMFIDPHKYANDVATDLPQREAEFLANAQVPVAAAAFDAPVTAAAWHGRLSYGIIGKDDRVLNPTLARWMYQRSGSQITEIRGNHLLHISHPAAVAEVIERAARAAALEK